MRKKLDTRFPAARIKKIMQADEDVGKIALAVPVLVSKALELFLQDLCDRTYNITLQKGAKTMNSLHLKHCVQSYNVFDFLRDIVSKVPDYGHGHTHAHAHSDVTSDDRAVSRRRKAVGDDGNETDDDTKKIRMAEMGHASGSRGRGRGRARGRGRGARNMDRELVPGETESEPAATAAQPSIKNTADQAAILDHKTESRKHTEETSLAADSSNHGAQPFDLNASSAENEGNSAKNPAATAVTEEATAEVKDELYPGWSLSEVDKMAIDPLQLANMSNMVDEDDEDYDEEG